MRLLLARLMLWQKFLLLAVLVAAMLAPPVVLVVRAALGEIETARRQEQGIAPLRKVLELVQLAQQHRGLSALALGGNDSARQARLARQQQVEQAFAALDAMLAGRGGGDLLPEWQAWFDGLGVHARNCANPAAWRAGQSR